MVPIEMKTKIALILLLVPCVLVGCREVESTTPVTTKESLAADGKSLKLVIDYGDGVEKHYPRLAWKEGLNVLDAMKSTAGHPRGIKYTTRMAKGGEAAFVESIDGVKNQGGGKEAKNWTYKVNGKRSPVGAGVQKLQPDDVVVWKFGVFEIE